MTPSSAQPDLRKVVLIVAFLNLAYFGVEFSVARVIGSVSLFADSIDFLEDAAVNLLIGLTLMATLATRSRMGKLLAVVILAPAVATLWTAWAKFQTAVAPEPVLLSATGAGALAINLTCAFLLARFRSSRGSLTRAAFLSARNDAVANIAIVLTGLATAFVWRSAWPDLVVGLAIAALNADAAREVWEAAEAEEAEGLSAGSP